MVEIYTRIDWVNKKDGQTTPLGATNLNKMDAAISEMDKRIVEMDAVKADKLTVNTMLADCEYDEETGIVKLTRKNGEQIVFDLNIEKIPVAFALSESGVLTMTTEDGTEWTADIGAMIPVLTFNNSDTVNVIVTGSGKNKTYSFEVKDGSITEDKLRPDYLAEIKVESGKAVTSATNAATSERNAAESAKTAQECKEQAGKTVTQTATDENYNHWRPVVVGAQNSANATFTAATETGETYVSEKIVAQPSTGTLKAERFEGNLDGNAATAHRTWETTITCSTWSRLCHAARPNYAGNCFILNVSMSRQNVLYHDTLLIKAIHPTKAMITKLSGSNYRTGIKYRVVVKDGDCYVEIYDNAPCASDTTTVKCSLIDIWTGNITTYTEFTDGTTLPDKWSVAAEITTNANSLQGNLSWDEITGKPDMTGATADADGTSGLVPAPLKGDQNKFLRADGTWVAPPESTLEETDPTVPDWAKQPTKPTYTAAEVGADAAGAADEVMTAVRNNYTTKSLTGVETDMYGSTNIQYEWYDVTSGYLGGEIGVESLNKALAEATRKIAETIAAVHGLVPKSSTTPVSGGESTTFYDDGIYTLKVYKAGSANLVAVYQYIFASDCYSTVNGIETYCNKLQANTAALSSTYGTIAVETGMNGIKITVKSGYDIQVIRRDF